MARVLIADSSEQYARACMRALASEAHRVRWAATMGDAVELALRWHPELVLASEVLDDGTALELIERLDAEMGRERPLPPIAVMSSAPSLPAKMRVLWAGATDYFGRPVPGHVLLGRVRVLLGTQIREAPPVAV
ncbi:MAG: response regulator transcription factor [Chromatiales bacterium]|nr:response regulator transcription factor [Chromatiales bacterium]